MPDTASLDDVLRLSSYHCCVERIAATWPFFAAQRKERLREGLFAAAPEKVAENIPEDLFTQVLDWNLADANLQVGRADIILSALGDKRLVGEMPYAADVATGGLKDRVLVALDSDEPPLGLWWISVHGIYRTCPAPTAMLTTAPAAQAGIHGAAASDELLHRKYLLPARCFAFVGAANNQSTWKLPYVLADGTPDLKRLPKALQSILSNFRGVKVSIPREAIPDVLVRLGKAAAAVRKMPGQTSAAANASMEAHQALDQLGRLPDVGCCTRQSSPFSHAGAAPT